MNKATVGARILLGLIFFVFGLNGFFNFITPPPPPEAGMKFLGALAESGYMFPLIKSIEVLTGALLLSGFFVPLALLLLAPIVVNILCYHAFLAPQGLPLPIVALVLGIFLAYQHRDAYRPLFQARS